jgi:hypothetical protein
MSAREAARHFGISRESVKKMLSFSVGLTDTGADARTGKNRRDRLAGALHQLERRR